MNHQTTIPAHLPKIVHLRGGDQLLNVDARTITSYTEFETFGIDELTIDDLTMLSAELTEDLGQPIADEIMIHLLNSNQ